ncbi:MAG: NTP transferase domain-containing protein [Candidatus Krumholzibacteria bacterium]|nr:NTP transferase domain-containing protein [Candidatus Krumholzibacteria bacterium]
MKMTGMILAAGLGTRMGKLSSFLPKPLVPVLGRPLFGLIADKLVREGAGHIHSNIHHLPEKIESYAEHEDLPVTFHREKILLDTGGGIGNMADSCRETDLVLLHNGDILTDISYGPAIEAHIDSGALFTMILLDAGTNVIHPPPQVVTDPDGHLVSIGGDPRDDAKGTARAGYTGLAIISPGAFNYFPRGEKAGLIEILLEMASADPGSVIGFRASEGAAILQDRTPVAWAEAGTPSLLLDLHRRILVGGERFTPSIPAASMSLFAGKGTDIAPDTRWKGFLSIGKNSVVKSNTVLEDCVILDDTVVDSGTECIRSIIYPDGMIEGE